MTITEVYDKYKHIDGLLASSLLPEPDFTRQIIRELCAAVKEAHQLTATHQGETK